MGHHFYQQHTPKASKHDALNLEPYITIEKERLTRKRELFHGIRFNLDKDTLRKIQHAKETGCQLQVSPTFLADLRYYALTDGDNRVQSDLTFCTYFLRGSSEEAVMRSVISMDGDILHQIKSDCLERPNFCRQIASAHYWLIEQLLSQLRLRTLLKLKGFVWGLSLLIVAALVIPFLPQLIEVNAWLLLVPLVMVWLLQMLLQRLLGLFLPSIRRWAWRRYVSGLLWHKPLDKKIAKSILQ